MLSNSAFTWAAARSGKSLPAFMAWLTPEREAELQAAYDAWRASKGLRPIPSPDRAEEPAPAAEEPAPPEPELPTDEADAAEDPEPDIIDELLKDISEIAEEAEEEQEEEAELIRTALTDVPIDDAPVPVDVESEMEEAIPAELPDDAEEAADLPEPAPVGEKPAAPERAEELSLLSGLPKAADPALYASILARFASREAATDAVKETWKAFTRRHRSTVGLRAFLAWLEGGGE